MTEQSLKRAFTLVELLVVISIIVVLMGLLIPAVGTVRENARKVQAKSDMIQIVNAIKSYNAEYGKYPLDPTLVTGTNDYVCDTAQKAALVFDVLRNSFDSQSSVNTTKVPQLNPRGITFIEAPTVKDEASPKSGVSLKGGVKGAWYDPWGTVYKIAMDASYDNQLNAKGNALQTFYSDTNFSPISAGAILWSYGKDLKIGTNGNSVFKNSDDVASWQ